MSIRGKTTIKHLQREIDKKLNEYEHKDDYIYKYHDNRWIDSSTYSPDIFEKIFVTENFFIRRCIFGICVNESPVIIEAGMSLQRTRSSRHWYITTTHESSRSCGYFDKYAFMKIKDSYMPYASDEDNKYIEFIGNCIDKHLCYASGNIIDDGINNFINNIPPMRDDPTEERVEYIRRYCGNTLRFIDLIKIYESRNKPDMTEVVRNIMKDNKEFDKHVRDIVATEHVDKINAIKQQIKEIPLQYIFKENLK